jgi:TfoX/Sxy family transcriptional regulator of competence genes
VAYDEVLAERIRDVLAADPDVTERKMFGGLAFLVRGNMAVAASGQGGLLVRIDVAEAEALLAAPGVSPMEMRGREMRGWVRVDASGVRTERQLARWVGRGTALARSRPPK